nr:PREDICTED: uncharacterized protein C4orf50 homolog isoform X2 [Lepisosteus oculatus]
MFENTERGVVQEGANEDLAEKVNGMSDHTNVLEIRKDRLKEKLSGTAFGETKLSKPFAKPQSAVKEVVIQEVLVGEQREQLAKLENKLQGKSETPTQEIPDKGAAVPLQEILGESQDIPLDIPAVKEIVWQDLDKRIELDKVGAIIRMDTGYAVDIKEKGINISEQNEQVKSLTNDLRDVQVKVVLHTESERKLQERNRMLESLLEDMQKDCSKNGRDKITRMEKLLSMREETIQGLQSRLTSQEQLLKEMEETQRRLSIRNEELGAKQRALSDEVHRWKAKCTNHERCDKEKKIENKQLEEKIHRLESESSHYESKLREKICEFEGLSTKKDKEITDLLSELKRLTTDFEIKESVWQKERQNLELQLRKKVRELQASDEHYKMLKQDFDFLKENICKLKQMETTLQQRNEALDIQLLQNSQLVTSLEETINRERQVLNSLTNDLSTKDKKIKNLQQQERALQSQVKDLQEDLEEAKRERIDKQPEEQMANQELQLLSQRVKVLEHSLRDNVNSFTESEEALKNRIKELEMSERNLLAKVDSLTVRSVPSAVPRQRQEDKLQMLKEEIQNMVSEKEKLEKVWKEKLHRFQNQIKMKEEEMRKQSEYFEHYKQKLKCKLGFMKEREQGLQGQIFKLEREIIKLTASAALLRTELEKHTLDSTAFARGQRLAELDVADTRITSFLDGGEDKIKGFIRSLQEDLNNLLEREEASHMERRELKDRLQDAEENEEFLSRKLEDFRSRIHELKLSESSLLEELEELAEENERLRRNLPQARKDINSKEECSANFENKGPVTVDSKFMDSLKSNQLNRLYTTITEFMEEQDLQSQYIQLNNALTDLKSKLQAGDIVFIEDMLQLKKEAVLDPSRNKAVQTPSLTQCLKESIFIAKLVPQLGSSFQCSCELLEQWVFPFLDNNSRVLMEIMQALRQGDLGQVKLIMREPETQSELSHLFKTVAEYELTLPSKLWIHNQSQDTEESQHEGDNFFSKHKETVVIHSQQGLLKVMGHKTQNTNFISLVTKTIDVDCSTVDNHTVQECSHMSSPLFTTESPAEGTESLKGTTLNLEADAQGLQKKKVELESIFFENAMQRLSEDEAKLKFGMFQRQMVLEEQETLKGENDLKLETLKNNWRQENKVLGKRNEELLEQIVKLEREHEIQIVKLHKQISQYQENISKLKEDNHKYCCTILELQKNKEEGSKLILELQESSKKMSSEILIFQEEKVKHHQNMLKLENENKQNLHHFLESQEKVEELLNFTSQLKKDLEDSSEIIKQLKEEKDQQQILKTKVEEENYQHSQTITNLEEKIENWSNITVQLKEELKDTTAENGLLETQIQALSLKLETLTETNNCLIHKINEQQEDITKGSKLILELQTEKSRSSQEIAELKKVIKNSEQEFMVLKNECETSAKKYSDLQEAHEQLTETVALLQEEKSNLERELGVMRIKDANNKMEWESTINITSDKNKELLEKVLVLENREKQMIVREAGIREEMDVLRRENEMLLRNNMDQKKGNLEHPQKENEGKNEAKPSVSEEDAELRKELGHMAVELKTSQEELKKAKTEAQKWYRDLGLAESKREEAVKNLSQAVNEVKRMRESVKEDDILRKENAKLRKEISEMKKRMSERESVPVGILELKSQLEDPTNMEVHCHELQTPLLHLQSQLDMKSAPENELNAENSALKKEVSKSEDWGETVKMLKSRYEDIRNQFDELLRKKTEAELDVAPLKARLACVVQKCQERNSLIIQLVRALRRHGFIDFNVIEEAEDLVNDTALMEYSGTYRLSHSSQGFYKDIWGQETQTDEEGPLQSSLSSGRGSLPDLDGSLSFRSCVATADYSPSPDMPSTVLPTLPLSAGEVVQVTGVPDNHGLYHAEVKGEAGLVPACLLEETEDLRQDLHPSDKQCTGPVPGLTSPERIIQLYQQMQQAHCSNYQVVSSVTSDSNPETDRSLLSTPCLVQGGRPRLFKSQPENEAEVAGRPSNVQGKDAGEQMKRGTSQARRDAGVILNNTWLSRDDANCCASAAAARSHLSELSLLNSQEQNVKGIISNSLFPEQRSIRAKLEPPSPVGSLQIVKTVGQSSLMIGWDRPPLDELGCSNGTFVYGYRIYVDGEFHKSVMSAACTKAVLENVDLSVPFQISVQTLGANGLFAEKVHILFQSSDSPAGAELSSRDLRTSHTHKPSRTQTNVSTPHQSKTFSQGSGVKPTKFIAIYNYSPLKDSPNIHPSRELGFREGDTVWVFGKPRRDGFCEAEVNRRRGLAPAAFLEKVNVGLPREKKEKAFL